MRIHTVQLNLGDLMGGTSRMDGTEFGAYALLFLNCYQDSTHALPLDSEECRVIARVTPKVWKRIRDKVMKKFTKTEDGYRHKRVDAELQKMLSKSSKSSANALKRWDTGNAKALPEGEVAASGSHSKGDAAGRAGANATQDTRPKNQKNNYDDQEAEKFWAQWPQERRCEKPKFYAAWKEAKRKCAPEQLLECARRYLDGKQAKEGFSPYPARWLKGERWLEVMDVNDGLAKVEFTMADLDGDTPQNREFFTILSRLREELGEAVFRSWLAPMRVRERAGSTLALYMPTKFMAQWVEAHFMESLAASVKKTWPEIQDIKFTSQPKEKLL